MSNRLSPSRSTVGYAVRKPLVEWLATQDVAGARMLDVGCGERPAEGPCTHGGVVTLSTPSGPAHAGRMAAR